MHKCIMVKVGGKRNTRKVCKKQVNLSKTEGNICQSRGERIIFAKLGKVLQQRKWGEIRNLLSMTKKRSSEILADENQEIFREKVKLLKFFSKSENFSKIAGNLKQGGNASWS